ncbi:hypothetical protein K432DRAFT_386739 [Lepidopterella palustris CBS 459.81]|uniref:Methyltransferase domain-containing protein n=1 Tax=Lepidopterella palustris CBS 459.81 TaxID=1314670 RepID=A0A8E2DZL3_9PEZI|nr:hypothetical protein K432DRAFT_386739 [Lepidopterella palustris CBS 459.81]
MSAEWNDNTRAIDDTTPKSQPHLSYLTRIVHKLYPPPRPLYGPCSLSGTGNEPKGIASLLYKAFPPNLQTDVPWYSPSIATKLKASGQLYSSYTGLEGTDLVRHVQTIRDRAWAIAPYPCIGRGWFLLPGLSGLKIWAEVVETAKEGKTVLDLGCGLGQDLRRLRAEVGAAAKLYAIDARKEMWELGCELFCDGKEPVAKFLCADARIRHPDNSNASLGDGGWLNEIRGSIDVVIMSQVLDLFFWSEQIAIGRTIVELSNVGTKVVGCTFGTVQGSAGEHKSEGDLGFSRMYHDDRSFGTLWLDIGKATATTWKVEAELVELEEWGFDEDDIAWMTEPIPRGLNFVVIRES